MNTGATSVVPERPQHKRNKSSVLKSIMVSRSHKRTTSEGTVLVQPKSDENNPPYNPHNITKDMPALPPNHPHAGQRVLEEIPQNVNPPSPKKSKEENDLGLRKKKRSSVNLRSLSRGWTGKDRPAQESQDGTPENDRSSQKRPKKSKSSTSIATMFAKANRSLKNLHETELSMPPKNIENTTPPSSASPSAAHVPIWAQFASQPLQETSTITNIPLNDQYRDVNDEIARYTPQDYSPSKQRNFHGHERPSLRRPGAPTQRPKSAYLPNTTASGSFMETPSRKISNDRSRPGSSKRDSIEAQEASGEQTRKGSGGRPVLQRYSSIEERKVSSGSSEPPPSKAGLTVAKRGARVMAAVAAFNGKAKEAEIQKEESKLDAKSIDAAFEAVLDSRNVPENMRQKMRTLNTRIKADFIKQDRGEATNATANGFEKPSKAPPAPQYGSSDGAAAPVASEKLDSTDARSASAKRSRPQSKTFTFSKADLSPPKKQKSESKSRPTSLYIPKSPSSKTVLSQAGPQAVGSWGRKTLNPTLPGEFVSYMRTVQAPASVEVGRLHKLRLLLRNETVAWVDAFIQQGGMAEIVALLHRIVAVEWREEHEDALLHEALLCLKGLCTTDLALRELEQVEASLFPALLGMLFDEEKKGPSEFTTRGIIINLLFTHLAAASASAAKLESRAHTLLTYLADPQKPEDAKPIGFVLDMHQRRPYRVWCKEMSNVTKEVFWIFLHHLNVIPLPSKDQDPSQHDQERNSAASGEPGPDAAAADQQHQDPTPKKKDSQTDTAPTRHAPPFFPHPRPPVPAAPYIGGVEWDSTLYLAAHLDLLNGLLASLPTPPQRNALRAELRASGFDKLAGGTLRTCKEKFYGAVHDGLRTWVAAAEADGWATAAVRLGSDGRSPRRHKSPGKGGVEGPPRLELAVEALREEAGAGVVGEWI
ncbi:hypothetical protein LTR04_003906 [Oleoguttula sp. CCFEE 6159]|nr:hypothetical protein LTR04_003906 [Oleoguttula sp. CCFEE 6159]